MDGCGKRRPTKESRIHRQETHSEISKELRNIKDALSKKGSTKTQESARTYLQGKKMHRPASARYMIDIEEDQYKATRHAIGVCGKQEKGP
jgi:hypothetical protein